MRPGGLRAVPGWKGRITLLDAVGNLGCDAEPHLATSHLGQGHGSKAAIPFICLPLFSPSDFLDGASQIPVPVEGVHGKIKMRVKNQHCNLLGWI